MKSVIDCSKCIHCEVCGDRYASDGYAGECFYFLEHNPKGEWIKHISELYPNESTEECPFCHEEQTICGNDDNFCPNCGADMKGGAE